MPGIKSHTVKLILRNKVNDWVNTLPKEFGEAVKKDVILTGGCVTSLMLGEKIHDYDVYFRTYETTLKVAEFYASWFNSNPENKVKGGIPVSVEVREETITNIKGIEEDRIVFRMQSSGVAAEGMSTYQYMEARPEEDTEEFMASLTEYAAEALTDDPVGVAKNVDAEVGTKYFGDGIPKAKYRPVFLTDNAVSLSDKMQLIIRFYGEPSELHENFDFVHACCYYDYAKHHLEAPKVALESMLSKTLVYGGSLYPVASLFRIRKFLNRGWRISAGQMLKIIYQVSKLDLDNKQVMREQLVGVDQAYMQQLITAISELKPHEKADSAYLPALIDKIFDE
jgi:hypothetical protein